MPISVEWYKNIYVQLWHVSLSILTQKSTVYEECSISSRPKVKADVLYNLALEQIKYTAILKL